MKEWLKTGTVASMIDMNSRTVRNWCKTGKFRSIKTNGGHFLVHRTELGRMVSAGKLPPSSPVQDGNTVLYTKSQTFSWLVGNESIGDVVVVSSGMDAASEVVFGKPAVVIVDFMGQDASSLSIEIKKLRDKFGFSGVVAVVVGEDVNPKKIVVADKAFVHPVEKQKVIDWLKGCLNVR